MPDRVLAHQPGPHHGTVGVDDPGARGPHRAVVGLAVGELLSGVEHRRAAVHARRRQPARPQARLTHAARPRRHLDLPVEAQSPHGIEIDSGSALHDVLTAFEYADEVVERRQIAARIESAPGPAAPCRVGDHDRVGGDRTQRVGPAQQHRLTAQPQVVLGHRQPYRIDVAADHALRRITKCRKLSADRAGHIVHGGAGQPAGSVLGHRCRGGLLQRLVGEQPARGVAELRRRPPAQPHSFHQHTGPLAESRSGRADLGDQRSIGELIPGDLVQRGAPFRAAQVGHIVEAERYDGLTPVTMTL